MDTWNREELYTEVWEQPLLKAAPNYGISAVALGKICCKLQIPLPGRGYWVKKEFGKPVNRLPLPPGKDIPIVHRQKYPTGQSVASPETASAPEPTDPEFLQIVELESRHITVNPEAKRHKLVAATERILKHASADQRGILQLRYDQPCLELRVSEGTLERTLIFVDAIIQSLEPRDSPSVFSKVRTEQEPKFLAIGFRSPL